jgi:hypothetical protein
VSHHDKSTQLQDALLAPGSRSAETAIGWISAVVAAALATFDVFTLTAIVRGSGNLAGLWTVLTVSAALTYFFATVGYRLVRARPNKVGSIASSAIWFICFAVFGILTLLFIAVAVAKRDFAVAQGATLSALLALLGKLCITTSAKATAKTLSADETNEPLHHRI